MDGNTIALIGVIVAAIVGAPSFIVFFKKPKTKILLIKEQHVNLYNDVVKNIPDLSIMFKGTPVHSNMFVWKGLFFCSGVEDIVSKDIDKGITLTIGGRDAHWHSFKIIDKTIDLDINVTSSESKLTIDFPLLKDNDYFILEALGQCDKYSVKTAHRISNVDDIEKKNITTAVEVKRELYSYLWTVLGCLVGVFIFFFIKYENKLKATYFNSNQEVVENYFANNTKSTSPPTISTVDTSITITMGNAFKRYTTATEDSLSIALKKHYSALGLVFGQKTKFYKVDNDHFVRFGVEYGSSDIFSSIFLIFLFFALRGYVIRAINYKREMRVANLASKLI